MVKITVTIPGMKLGEPNKPIEVAEGVQFTVPVMAVNLGTAAKMLSISRWTLRRRIAAGHIKKTRFDTIPVSELERHLRSEMRGIL